MRIGVGSYAFRWSIGIGDRRPAAPMTPAALINAAADLGAEIVQFADNMPLHEAGAQVVADLRRAARESGVEVQLGVASADRAHLRTYLRLAEHLDARVVRVAPSPGDMARERGALRAALREAGGDFASLGCVVALENYFHLAPQDLADLVSGIGHPNVCVCLDVANSIATGQGPAETVRLLAPQAGNLHIKDYEVELDPHGVGMRIVGAPIGAGRMDLGMVIDALSASPRGVDAIIEHWLPLDALRSADAAFETERDWTARSLAALRRKFAAGA